jgi:hypothetical protein
LGPLRLAIHPHAPAVLGRSRRAHHQLTGAINQEQTNGQPANWIDYSNTVNGNTEGLAVFSHPQNPAPHKWLTRDYGTFGPRRPDDRSGVPFTLRRNESITQRVGILVHRGDVESGQVAERFERANTARPPTGGKALREGRCPISQSATLKPL